MLGGLAAAAAISTASPSQAAYGDAARVFAGNVTNKSGASASKCFTPPLWQQPGLARALSLFLCCTLCLAAAGFVPYAGEGFAVLIPSKWNPSKEQDFPGTVLRCASAQPPAAQPARRPAQLSEAALCLLCASAWALSTGRFPADGILPGMSCACSQLTSTL